MSPSVPDSVPDSGADSALAPDLTARLRRTADGLVAVIVQEHRTHEVLMLAWMDDEALRRTLATGQATYWSRSRGEHWRKGASSGHVQRVVTAALDCDGDTVLLRVEQTGVACHTGDRTCFDADPLPVLSSEAGKATG